MMKGKTLFFLTLAGVLLQAGCSRGNAGPADTPAKVEANLDPTVISIDHPQRFPLVEVETRKLADELRVNGVVTTDVNRSVPVLSPSGGRVVEIRVRLGDDVKKGQVLLLIARHGSPKEKPLPDGVPKSQSSPRSA